MTRQVKKATRSGRRGDPISLAGVSLDDAMRAALKVKLTDVQKLERQETERKKRSAKK